MEKITVSRLIEWLKKHNHDDSDIVDCMEYITSGDKPEKKESTEAK